MVVLHTVLREILINTSRYTRSSPGESRTPQIIISGFLNFKETSQQQAILSLYDGTGRVPAIFNIAEEDREWKTEKLNSIDELKPYRVLCNALSLPNEEPAFMLSIINFAIDLDYYFMLGPVMQMDCYNYERSLTRNMASLSVQNKGETDNKENDSTHDANSDQSNLELSDDCQRSIVKLIQESRSSNVAGLKKETLFKNLEGKFASEKLETAFDQLLEQCHIFETIAGFYDTF